MASSESFALPSLHDHDIVDVRVDPTGTFVASSALDGTVAVYNLVLRQSTHFFELNQTPSCMAWVETKPDLFTLIVGSREGILHQITLRDDTAVSTHQILGNHEEAVSSISQRGAMLVTAGGSELTAWIFDRSADAWIRMYTNVLEHHIQHVVHLDDEKLVLVTQNRQLRFLELVTGRTLSIVKAGTSISGIATIGSRLMLSVSRCCRLTVIDGRSKVSILRSPILDARLQSIPNVPLMLAEGNHGDICVWNHEIGRVLALSDPKEGGGRLKFLNVLWNPQYPGLIFTGLAPSQPGKRPRIIIRKVPRASVADAIFLPVILRQTKFKLMKAPRHSSKVYMTSAKR